MAMQTSKKRLSVRCGIVRVMLALSVPGVAIAGGQAVGLKHPVLDHKLTAAERASLEQSVAPLMALSETEACAFVPPYGYVQYCECPVCYGGVEGNDVLRWSFERPEELKCRFCGTVVYPNPAYPETHTLVGQNMLGETIALPYYLNEARGVRHFFRQHLWMHKRRWLIARITEAARLYVLTGEAAYARRVAVVLDAFARAYPHYPVLQNGPRRVAFLEQKLGWPWDAGRWNYFHNEIPAEILPAYDLTYDSSVYEELSRERGYDVREKIEQDFIKAAAQGAIARRDPVSNVAGYDIRAAALAGRIINEPALVHWAYHEMLRHVREGFFRDGVWKEGTPSYHAMTVGGLQYAFEAIRGYTDPPGYVDPATGERLENVQPERDWPLWARCQRAPERVAWPNGCSVTIHDTHPYERRSVPREASLSAILPGLGHLALARGRGPHQLMAQLHFSGGYGHQHADNLNLALWAKERELLPDIGYTWTQLRYWASCSLGHNLVVVDRQDQDSAPPGNLLLYEPGDRENPEALTLAVAEAAAEKAYASRVPGLDLYRRLIILVPVSAEEAYVIDIFRVRGGKIHDWTIQGDADRDTIAEAALPFSAPRRWLLEEGEKWEEPTLEGQRHNPYGMIRDVREALGVSDFEICFREAEERTRGLRCWLRMGEAARVFLGRSPSVRRMGVGTQGDMRKAYDFWMPKLIVRRMGETPLESVFVAVYEPLAGEGYIRDVKRLTIASADKLAVALQIEHIGGVDTIISAGARGGPEVVAENGVRLNGQIGFVRRAGKKIVALELIEGKRLAGADFELTTAAEAYAGEIEATMPVGGEGTETAFVTRALLPEGKSLAGRWLIATFPGEVTQGYEIKTIQREGERTLIVLAEDPGVQIAAGRAEETCFPRRSFPGPIAFRIPGAARLRQKEGGVWEAVATSRAEFRIPR